MIRRPPEPVQVVKQRRDAALRALVEPYAAFLGMRFDRRSDELTAVLPLDEKPNPLLPALHGGATAAFLGMAAMLELAWATLWEAIESSAVDPAALTDDSLPRRPRTIDNLRSGLPRDAYARARGASRSGRRHAIVHVEAWQDNRSRTYAQAAGHFPMSAGDG